MMNKKIVFGFIGLGLALAVAFTAIGSSNDKNEPKSEMAPPIQLVDIEGNSFDLSTFEGEQVYVKFWASWCSICLAGMDELNQLAAQDNGFKVVTIVAPGINGEQEKAAFIQWFKSLEYKNIQVLLDETGAVTKAYGVRAYPTSVFIDAEGQVMLIQPGHVSNERIKEVFEGIQ